MLLVASVLLLNATAPLESGPLGPDLVDEGLQAFLADDRLASWVPVALGDAPHVLSPEAGPAEPTGPPEPALDPAERPAGLVVPHRPDGIDLPLPCVYGMHAGFGFGACGDDVVDALLPPRPAPPPIPAPPAATTALESAGRPEGNGMDRPTHQSAPLTSAGLPDGPAQTPIRPGDDPQPSLEAGRAGPDEAMAVQWLGRAAAMLAPTLLLAKLLASLAVKARRRTSPARDVLVALVGGDPGIHHMELVRRSGFGNGTVQHHLRNLVEEGRIVRVATAGHTCFFPVEPLDPTLVRLRTAVRSPLTRKVLQVVAAGPRSLSAVSEAVGLPVSTVHYHVGKLVRAGALAPGRVHGRRGLAVTPLGRTVLG